MGVWVDTERLKAPLAWQVLNSLFSVLQLLTKCSCFVQGVQDLTIGPLLGHLALSHYVC